MNEVHHFGASGLNVQRHVLPSLSYLSLGWIPKCKLIMQEWLLGKEGKALGNTDGPGPEFMVPSQNTNFSFLLAYHLLQPGYPQSPFGENHIPSARTPFPPLDLLPVGLDLLHWPPYTAYLAGWKTVASSRSLKSEGCGSDSWSACMFGTKYVGPSEPQLRITLVML